MQLLLILAGVTLFCLWNRRPERVEDTATMSHKASRDHDQIERLKARVTTLEEILLDRDRRLRDDFRGI